MPHAQLKIGFLCTNAPLNQWQAMCIEEMAQLSNVEIHLFCCQEGLPFDDSEEINKKNVKINRLKKNLVSSRRLWNVFYYFFLRDKIRYFDRQTFRQRLKEFPTHKLDLVRKQAYKFAFSEAALEIIRPLNFDVLINLELGFLTGEILNLPKHGVWSFHHGDEEKYRGLPPGFWEVYHKDSTCGLVLQRLTEELDAGYILEKGFVPTHLRSYRKTLNNLFSVGHQWPAKVCRRLLTTDFSTLQTKSKTKAKILIAPTNWQMLVFLSKLFIRNIHYLFNDFLLAERWRIGVLEVPIQQVLKTPLKELKPYWLPNTEKNVFNADPFGYITPAGPRIIFESFDYRVRVGRISSTQFNQQTKTFETSRHEITRPYHLSYPFTFKYQGETYALVETYTENKLFYFKLAADGSWHPYLELPSIAYRNDSTLFEHEGRWYLFYTEGLTGANLRLNIAYADSPFGPFQNHLLNPVKIDIRSARSAGPIFTSEGRIYRPSQNSTHGYGSSISVHQITRLSPTEYTEQPTQELVPPPEWGRFEGMHTITKLDEKTTLIDCNRSEWIWASVAQVIKNRLKRLLRI